MPHQPPVNDLTYGVTLLFGPQQVQPDQQVAIQLPPNMREILASIFNDAVRTQVQFTGVGFVAIVPGVPRKVAEVAPGRLMVVGFTSREAAEAIIRLSKAIMEGNPKLGVTEYGYNFEFEFSIDRSIDAGQYVAERFFRDRLTTPNNWSITSAKFSCTLKHTHPEGGPQRSVQLEPRVGKPSYFFANVNCHFPVGAALPTSVGKLATELETEYDATRDFVLELLERPGRKRKKKKGK